MMNNLNSILVEGNLVRDPELSYTPKGTAMCKFSVASNRFYKQEEELQKEVSFFEVSTWARLAEVCGEYLKKGRGVRIVGRLAQDRWTDPEGKAKSRIYIVAEHVEFKPQFNKDKVKDGEAAEGEQGGEAGEAVAPKQEEEVAEAVSF
jgi:single-strand DNA-binding protein